MATEIQIEAGSIDFSPWSGERVSVGISLRDDGRFDIRIEAHQIRQAGHPLLPPLRLTCQGLSLSADSIDCPQGVIEGLHPHRIQGQWLGRWDGHAWRLQCRFRALEVAQLLKWGAPWNDGFRQITDASGVIDLQAELVGTAQRLTEARLTGSVREMTFNGPSAAEDAGGSFQWTAKSKGEIWETEGQLRLTNGQVYLEPGITIREVPLGFAMNAPSEGLSVAMKVRWDPGKGQWDIDSVRFLHPKVADLMFSGSFRLGGEASLSGQLQAKFLELGAAYQPYLQPFLVAAGLGDVETAGALDMDVRLRESRLTDFRIAFRDIYLDDGAGRFSIAALNGDLALASGPVPSRSRLRWAGGGLYRLDLGAGALAFVSQGGNLWLHEKTRLPVLDGGLAIDALRMEGIGRKDFSMRLDARLMPLSFVDFTHAMGWPAMSGTLSGVIPGVLYRDGNLRVGGTILIQAFDGRIVVQDLRIEQLFGPVPMLGANILFKALDLESLTGAFSFGKIQGRLNGQMQRLRLEDWQPVSFDAEFATPEEDDRPHRISQRAVENLTSIGGGMTVSAASGILLRMFDEFSYDRLGLKCLLHEGVCHMDGIRPVDGGYAIVTRGWLPPWIEVKGFNRQVDWAVLVERLKGVTQSPSPVIE
jgi:hypothetical protein